MDVLNEIYKLKSSKIKLGLKNIKNLLVLMGNPEKNFKTIAVAGTNGKGSVCNMVGSILKDAGYKVGVYSSPHLVDFNERIVVNNKQIPEKEIVRIYKKIKPLLKKQKASFFEITTAIALEYFKDQKVDYAVLEVGLGGRLG